MAQLSLHWIDYLIVAAYVLATLVIGFVLSRRASQSIDHYFLGGKSIPWYALGLSNASGMFDISGTMWLVALLFIYGMKSVWIPWLWPTFNQIFLMVYLSIWLRRSGVMTGAEWIKFRFGENRGAHLSHLIVVFFAIINVIGFLAYGFIGIGKFAATFLPWDLSGWIPWAANDPAGVAMANAQAYGLIITALTTVYVVKGGMLSVVFTEVLQFAIMTVGCVWLGALAMRNVTPEQIDAVVPDGWRELFFGQRLNLRWSILQGALRDRVATDGCEWFSLFFFLVLSKGWMQSLAGPAPNYDMQRVLSARTPIEAAKMSGFVNVVLLLPRYMMVTGLAVLAIAYCTPFLQQMEADTGSVDFEAILPVVLRDHVPAGLLGLLIAALLAAFMSTYAATVNAAPAYVVNDIYRRYFRPTADAKHYVWLSYVVSILVVVLGTTFGFMTKSINDIVQWIVSALYGGYAAANLLKWHWWRFNGYGYFWGMLNGIVAAGIVPLVAKDTPEIYTFPAIFAFSLAGCLAGSLLTKPDDIEVLKQFYLRVRPWGYWGPIARLVQAEHSTAIPNSDFARDMSNVVTGIVWHTALTATGIYLVLRDLHGLMWSLVAIVVTSLILKFRWYDRLRDYPQGCEPIDTGRHA